MYTTTIVQYSTRPAYAGASGQVAVETRSSGEERIAAWALAMRAGGKNPTGFEYATTSGEAGCARPALPPEGAARTRKWHSGKPPREAEALHPLRIRVARLPRPGRWERRPDLLLPCQHTYNRAAWR